MNSYYLNKILDREEMKNDIKNKLIEFEKCKNNISINRGIYIYGYSGIGKTEFIKDILNELNYDIVYFDSGDVRNKKVIEKITNENMSDINVLSMLHKKPKKIVIVMDEIDSMNNGDKSGMSTLIKLSRGKKTKKQKKEATSMTPIICIGNYHIDKKIKELMKFSSTYELKKPTSRQMELIISEIMPSLEKNIKFKIIDFLDGDLRKLKTFYDIYYNNSVNFNEINELFEVKINNEYSKDLINQLLEKKITIKQHNLMINETDRTTISLLFHENIIDNLEKKLNEKDKIENYYDILNNYIYCDYIDRITFQKQIWIFNELTSVLKNIKTNNIYHDYLDKKKTCREKQINNINDKVIEIKKKEKHNLEEHPIRFTKILTKYSTEYNNRLFLNDLCYKLSMDKKDMISYFCDLKTKKTENEIYEILQEYDISKLDLQRILKIIDKYIV